MLYPKLKKTKQKKAKNNKRPTAADKCSLCSAGYAELHEVFYGKNRQKSIEYGMQIRLCYMCHRHQGKGEKGVHHNPQFNFNLKQTYQAIFEQKYSRQFFIKEFGRSYLDMTFEEFRKGEVA